MLKKCHRDKLIVYVNLVFKNLFRVTPKIIIFSGLIESGDTSLLTALSRDRCWLYFGFFKVKHDISLGDYNNQNFASDVFRVDSFPHDVKLKIVSPS